MKLIKTYENCFDLIKDLHNSGLSITMANSRRWHTDSNNDNNGMVKILPNITYYDIEVRGNKSNYHNFSDLEVLCDFLREVLEWIDIFYTNNPDIIEEERFDYSKYIE